MRANMESATAKPALLHKGWLDRNTLSGKKTVFALEHQLNKLIWFLECCFCFRTVMDQ